jgi:hypothetical protein
LLNSVLGSFSSGVAASTSSYESIASATGTGSSATITFSSIPSTYKHLQIRWIARSTFSSSSAIAIKVYVNSDTGANYAYHQIFGDGVSATATGSASQTEISLGGACAGNSMTSGIMGTGILDIADYASTSKTKTLRLTTGIDSNTSAGSIRLSSALWNSTTAMSSISFETNNGNFGTTSTFALYGIKG